MGNSVERTDPREILDQEDMSRVQIIAVGICVLLNALDGFDVLSISFASPGIAADWGINRAELGIVLSMELIGMAVGSFFIGRLADVYGRRPIILGSLMAMTAGMMLAATTNDMITLSIYRVFTGIGIGGILASINAMASEFSNKRNKALAVTIMASGYPLGAVVGGTIASMLLVSYDWRAIFIFGGIVTATFIPLVWFMLPESIYFLAHKRPKNALEKINATLKRLGHSTVSALPELDEPDDHPQGLKRLFAPDLARITVLLTFTYFAHIISFYYIIKWIPKIVADFGFHASSAGGVLVWANVGGATGAIVLGLLTRRYGVRGLTIGALAMTFVAIGAFGQVKADLTQFAMIAAVVGFCSNAGIVGLYALFADIFPTEVRAGGTGFVIGLGRGGAALGPVIAGFLFTSGYQLPSVSAMMATGSLIGAIALMALGWASTTKPDAAKVK